jgi:phytoene dehydrogenase-like protein
VAEPRSAPSNLRGRIEGGIDAVVIGADFDALAAAALLGKAGLKTVVLGGSGAALDEEPREFWGGYFCIDGEHLVASLDPELIAALDLYRHGLEFARRRLDSVYFFADGGALLMDGDLYRTRESVAAMAEHDGSRFADFLEMGLDAARALRPFFEGGPFPQLQQPISSAVERFLSAPISEVLDAAFDDAHLKALLTAEAIFRTSSRPNEPFGFAALLSRWAGETAGLQGAIAYPKFGAVGVKRAIRRAAQAARVELRPSTQVARVIVEWDATAGVETADGGQLRAPVVVSSLSASDAFVGAIGAERLDIEFHATLAAPRAELAAARVHFALSGEPGDERTRANMGRRLFYAPSADELVRAIGAARRGGAESPLVMEAVFPSVFDPGLAPAHGHVVSALVHPVALREPADAEFRALVAASAKATLERMAPGVGDRIVATDVVLAGDPKHEDGASSLAARPNLLERWGRAQALTAPAIAGYHFCGAEARIADGLNGAAGRRAAQSAIRYFKERVRA